MADAMTSKLTAMLHFLLILASAIRRVNAYSKYSSYSSGYSSYSSNRYDEEDYIIDISVCDDSVVRLVYLTLSCDSPYTFYYGNGANRNSPTCNYGDRATLTGKIKVVDDLQYGDDIYMTLAAYDDAKNLLMTVDPTNFCNTYIGYACTTAGLYEFSSKVTLSTPEGANQTHFTPRIQMAFSTKADSGYNLGAVNTKCPKWDQENPTYVDWSGKAVYRSPLRRFVADNGMLIGTCVSIAWFAVFVYRRAKAEEYDLYQLRGNNSREESILELG